jgi:hypothetical protein
VEADQTAEARLRKVAIVSLHEKAAQEAKALIDEGTDSTIVVLNELAVGSATRSATVSDVILFVWSANKHAVYGASDAVRERAVHVQDTGAGSIVLALERWAAARQRSAVL